MKILHVGDLSSSFVYLSTIGHIDISNFAQFEIEDLHLYKTNSQNANFNLLKYSIRCEIE